MTYILSILFFILYTVHTGFAEPQLSIPVIKANSTTVSVRDGNNLLKEIWTLDPKINPDIYRTQSSTDETLVTFITDIDSISFQVNPNEEYDFIVILNGKDTCYTKISSFRGVKIYKLTGSVFTKAKVSITVFSFILLTGLVGWYFRNRFSIYWFLSFGYIIPILIWGALLTSVLIDMSLGHSKDSLDEMGAIGSHSEIFMSTSELIIGLITIPLLLGYYKTCKRIQISLIPILPLLTLPIGIIGVSFYPIYSSLYVIFGSCMLSFIISPLLALSFWRNKQLNRITQFSIITLIILLYIFSRYFPSNKMNYDDLILRLYILGGVLWYIMLSYSFRKELRKMNIINKSSSDNSVTSLVDMST